jgi:hypothetical protein
MDRIENDGFNNSTFVPCVFVAAVKFLSSRCLATIGKYTYGRTEGWEGFMKYTVEMGSGARRYVPDLIKIGSGIQKLMGGGRIHRHRQHCDVISLILFSQNKGITLTRGKKQSCVFY